MLPLFIGGAARSGTTLTVDMLGLHSELSPIYETDFVITFLEWIKKNQPSLLERALKFCLRWSKSLSNLPHNEAAHERFHHGPTHILFKKELVEEQLEVFLQDLNSDTAVNKVRSFIFTLFASHAQHDNKPFWINKTPKYIAWLPQMKLLFPKMKFVHCIRDGRDVACSIVERPFGPNTYIRAAHNWKSSLLLGREFGEKYPEHYLEMKYEDLVLDPKPTLQCLFQFLGFKDESDQIIEKYHKNKDGISLVASRIGNWRNTFSTKECQEFWELNGSLLNEVGYPHV